MDPQDRSKSVIGAAVLHGIERLCNVDLYYSTFYDSHGFELALKNYLTLTPQNTRQILYVGRHGGPYKKAQEETMQMLKCIAKHGGKAEGVILSSCFLGGNDKSMIKALSRYRKDHYGANWIFGYKYAVDWLGSILLEMAILEQLFDEGSTKSKEGIVDIFKSAIGKFNKDWKIGTDKKERDKSLSESINLLVRPQGSQRAENITEELLQELKWED